MTQEGVKLIVQSGILPKETLRQLVEWKLLPEEVLKEAGSRKALLEGGWSTAEKFVEHLNDVISREAEAIRETDLTGTLTVVPVAVIKVRGRRDPFREDVEKDRMGRVHLPAKFIGKAVEGINIGPGAGEMVRVLKTEERYDGDKPAKLVCYLEER